MFGCSKIIRILRSLERGQERIEEKQGQTQLILGDIVATLDDILAEVTAEKTQIDSVLALVTGLKQQLTDALSGVTLPSGVQEKIDAAFNAIEANKTELQGAIDANTAPTP